MSYRIEITANTLAELAGKAASLAAKLNSEPSVQGVAEAAPVNPTPDPQTSSSASWTPASDTSNGQPDAQSEPEAASSTAPSSPNVPDFDTVVTPLVLKLVEVKGKPAAQEVLGRFGVVKASQLDSGKWAELVSAINDELAA